jgi:nicotinamide-nucleotide amidase
MLRQPKKIPFAAVLSIGDELLRGLPDTNGPAIQAELAACGLETRCREVVGDSLPEIADALRRLLADYAVVICCGGLGPTQDDLTRLAAARALKRPLAFHAPAWRAIQARFRRMQRRPDPVNRVQAMIPSGSTLLPNAWGTAPGFWLQVRGGCFAALPGPPNECLPMLRRSVLPRLRSVSGPHGFGVRRAGLRVCGRGEADLQAKLGPMFPPSGQPELSFLLDEPGEILVTLTVRGMDALLARTLLRQGIARIRRLLGADCVGDARRSLPEAAGRLLSAQGRTLAVAESCTGGLICRRLTSVPGSSRYFREGVVAYHNQAKLTRLGVPQPLLAKHGAVSEPVAAAMAAGIRRTSGADWGVSVTGIAGPGGGTKAKPVGLVCLGLAGPGPTRIVRTVRFLGERDVVQRRSATLALDLLRRQLLRR